MSCSGKISWPIACYEGLPEPLANWKIMEVELGVTDLVDIDGGILNVGLV